jgi:hypothetical protein
MRQRSPTSLKRPSKVKPCWLVPPFDADQGLTDAHSKAVGAIFELICELDHTRFACLVAKYLYPAVGRDIVAREIRREYQSNPDELDGWLRANAVLGSIIAGAILAMALAGLYSERLDTATEFSSVNASK